MMRHAAAFGGGGLGGADVEAGVDLESVGGDDLGGDVVLVAQGEGEVDGEVRLAAGGGSADDGGLGWKRGWGHESEDRGRSTQTQSSRATYSP